MKKKVLAMVVSVMLLLTMAVAMPVSATTEAADLAVNGGFEETTTEEVLTAWEFANTTQDASLISNADEAQAGNNYLKFTGSENAQVTATFDVEAGKTYTLQVYYKATEANAAKLQVYDAIGRAYAYQETKPEKPSEWTATRAMITVGKTMTPTVKVVLANVNAAATVCFDTVTLTQTEHDYTNMILNGGLEADTAKGAEGENITNWFGGNANKLESGTKNSGNNSIAIRQGNEGNANILINKEDGSATAEGDAYKFSFWINDSALTEDRMPWLRLWPLKMHGDATTSARGDLIAFNPVITAADTWTKCEYDVTLPADVNYVRIQIFSGAGWTRLDDLEFVQTEAGTITPEPEPDYDLEPEEGNLLLNGSFEVGTNGSTTIPGWTQTGANNNYSINNHPSYIANDGGVQGIYVDLASGLGDAGLKQTVTIDKTADWYTNYKNYSYNLSYTAYAAGSLFRGKVNVTMTGEDGAQYTRTYNPAPTAVWSVLPVTLDLESQTLDVGGPVASIDVELIAYTDMYEMRWDGIKLEPVTTALPNLIKNGSFEVDEENATDITYWTQTGESNTFSVSAHPSYVYGADGGSKSLFANLANGEGAAGLKQTVTVDTNALWYTDYENYKYQLEFYSYAAGSILRGGINVTATGTNGRSITTLYAPVPTTTWAMNYFVVDLTNQIKGVGGPIASFDVEVVASGTMFEMRCDAIKLYPVYEKAPESFASNGSFEDVTEEGTLDSWRIMNTTADESLISNAAEAHTGDNYLKFEGVSNMLATATYEVEYGKTYMLEVFYKSTAANAARVQLIDSAGRTHVYQDTRPEAPADWTPTRALITIGKSMPTPTIRIYLANMNEEATVCFDTVKLYCMGDFDGNMIANGDLEADVARNAEWENITNWFGGNGVKLDNTTAHSGKNSYAVRQQNQSDTHAILNFEDRAVTQAGDKFVFSMWINDSNLTEGKLPWVRLWSYKMNSDSTLSARGDLIALNPVIEAANTWTKCEFVVEFPEDVNYVRIQMFSGEGWTRFDDFELRKVETKVEITDTDGNVLTELPEVIDGTYTARATYLGEAEKARVYIAEYEIVDGAERLVEINCASFEAESTEAECAIEIEGANAENTVIRAFIWEGGMLPAVKTALQ